MKSRTGVAILACGCVAVLAFVTGSRAAAQSGSDKKALMGVIKPIGPYTPGVSTGNMVFLAGQVGIDPATNALVTGGIKAETKQAMENLGKVLQEAGLNYGNVVKTTIFMADLKDFADMNEVYGSFFPAGGTPPARSTVQVAAIPRGAHVEIDFIAMR
jgi:2-iminobutanoate/2-iminopropanoate deaminase